MLHYYFTWIIYIYYMPLSGFTHASCYTWYYVTGIRERHSSSFCLLLLLFLWVKVSYVLLHFRSPKLAGILTQSCAFHTELSHWDCVIPSALNICCTCPLNKLQYVTGIPFWPTANSHRMYAVVDSSINYGRCHFTHGRSYSCGTTLFFGDPKYFSPP